MYQLYINENTCEIKLSKMSKHFERDHAIIRLRLMGDDDEILHYNENCQICKTRKPLLQLARDTKANWLTQAKARIDAIEKIKI